MADETPGIEIARCAELTKQIVAGFESGAPNDALEAPTMDALRFLWDQSNRLHDLVQSRPGEQGRSGRDYVDGVKLGDLAYEIALKLRERGLKAPEEIALRIRLKAILQVQAHYHHIIGPAMLEHGELLVALGRSEEAAENHDCVIGDFSWLLDEYDGSGAALNGDDRISLEALRQALSKRLGMAGLDEAAAAELRAKLSRAEALLSAA